MGFPTYFVVAVAAVASLGLGSSPTTFGVEMMAKEKQEIGCKREAEVTKARRRDGTEFGYSYTSKFVVLDGGQRFVFHQLNRPGPPQPIVIVDPFPMEGVEADMNRMAEDLYLSQGINVVLLNSFESECGAELGGGVYDDVFEEVLKFIQSDVSRATPVAISSSSFRGGRALEYVTDNHHKYNVVAIYVVDPVLSGFGFLFRDRMMGWGEKFSLVNYAVRDLEGGWGGWQYVLTFDGVSMRAGDVFKSVVWGYSNRFLQNVNPESVVRIVRTGKGQAHQFEYWESDYVEEGVRGSFLVDVEASSDKEIVREFQGQFRSFFKKRREDLANTKVKMPEISGYNDYRKFGLDKLDIPRPPKPPT